MTSQLRITRGNVFVIAFFVLLAGLLSLLYSLLEPFLSSFVWATILVMVFYPLYSRFLALTRKHASLAAFLTTLVVTAVLVLPGIFVVENLGKELPNVYAVLSSTKWDEKSRWLMDQLKAQNVDSWLKSWGIDSDQADIALQKTIADGLQNFSHMILQKVTNIFENLAVFVLQAAFVLVALFFFFRDGSRLSLKVIELLPMEKDHKEKVVDTLSVTVTAVVRAVFLNSLVQGIMAGLGFVAAGVPAPILLALLAFVAAFIPVLTAAGVWVPVAVWLYLQGNLWAAVGLFLWGVVMVVVDNLYKPWIIGSSAKLPIFWLFFTTIGGLKVYGFLGIFLGPIILSLGMAFLAIYKDVYLNLNRHAPSKRSPE